MNRKPTVIYGTLQKMMANEKAEVALCLNVVKIINNKPRITLRIVTTILKQIKNKMIDNIANFNMSSRGEKILSSTKSAKNQSY